MKNQQQTKIEDQIFTDIAFIIADLVLYTQTHNKVNTFKWQKQIHKKIQALLNKEIERAYHKGFHEGLQIKSKKGRLGD